MRRPAVPVGARARIDVVFDSRFSVRRRSAPDGPHDPGV
jgi:hypothetical protein